jgi:hypothetical protein
MLLILMILSLISRKEEVMDLEVEGSIEEFLGIYIE